MRLNLRLLLLCSIAVPQTAAAQSNPRSQSSIDRAREAVEKIERDRTPQVLRDTFGGEVRCGTGPSASECAKRMYDAAEERAQRFRNPASGRSYGGVKQGTVGGTASPDELLEKFNAALAAGNTAAADQYMTQYRKMLDSAAEANLAGLAGGNALDRYVARNFELERQMGAATTQGQTIRLGDLQDENTEAMHQEVLRLGRAAVARHGIDPSIVDGAPGRRGTPDSAHTRARVGAKPKIIEVRRGVAPRKKADIATDVDDEAYLIAPLTDTAVEPGTAASPRPRERIAAERRALEKKMRDARADYDRILAERDAVRAGKKGASWADEDGISARRGALEQTQLEYEDFLRDNAPGELASWQQSTGRASKPGRWGDNDRILLNARERKDAAYRDYVRAVEGQRANPTPDGAAYAKAMEDRFAAASGDYDQAVKQVAPERYNREVRAQQDPGGPVELVPGMTSDLPSSAPLGDYDGPAGTGPSNAPGVADAPSLKNGMTEKEAELYDRMVGLEQQYLAAVHDIALADGRETASQMRRKNELGEAYSEAKQAFRKAQRERP